MSENFSLSGIETNICISYHFTVMNFFSEFFIKETRKILIFFFFWLKKYLFIYFSLCWVFIALCRLSVVVSGDHCCGARDSYCGGFLSCRA